MWSLSREPLTRSPFMPSSPTAEWSFSPFVPAELPAPYHLSAFAPSTHFRTAEPQAHEPRRHHFLWLHPRTRSH